jgi:large repetitive protein
MKAQLLILLAAITFSAISTAQVPAGKGYPLKISLENDRVREQVFFNQNGQKVIQVCNLKEGQTYAVWAVPAEDCPVSVSTADGSLSGATFEFTASGECMEFVMGKDLKSADCSGGAYFSMGCRSCEKKGGFQEKMAALAVAGGMSGSSLIKDVFIGGDCFDITNVTEIGSGDGKGTFASGTSSIGLEQGVILETGSIYNAPGPNNSNGAGNVLTGGGSDPDLSLLTNGALFDIVGIEFDFQPTLNMINFEFAFASEEYCEWVGSQFNDVFGFFISGPGISGPFSNNGANIAVLPGGTYVAINTVNHLSNTGYFVPNQTNCNAQTNMTDIQFDGYTTVLSAVANVIPCETYHIRLLISDVGDGIFDSAVFLKANSFNAGGTATGEIIIPSTGSNFVYENCDDGFIVFTRVGGDLSQPFVIPINVLPSSTATPGLDYAPLPGSVVIPAGQTQIILPIDVYSDFLIEGTETIVIGLENSCQCSSLEMIFEIQDTPPLDAELSDEDLCAGIPVVLEPTVSGGVFPFSYQWSTGDVTPFLIAAPGANTTYSVTVTDQCGTTATATSNITVNQIPTAILSGSGFLCSNSSSSIDLSVAFTGTAPWTFVYSINGVPQPAITTSMNPYIFSVNTPGTYEMVSVVSFVGLCDGPAIGVAPILMVTIDPTADPTPATCTANGTVTVSASGGLEPYSYEWSNGVIDSTTITGLGPDTFTVTVTDLNGCSGTAEAIVTQAPPLEVTPSAPTGVTCVNPNGGSIELVVSGGLPAYNYAWTGGIGNVQNPTGLTAGMYTVTVTDENGCAVVDSIEVGTNTTPPDAFAAPGGIINCNASQVQVLGQGSSSGTNFIYQWTGPGIASGADSINVTVNAAGTYNLLVTDNINGCTATANTTVLIDTEPPVAAASGGVLNCSAGQLQLDGAGSSAGANFNYLWTGPSVVSGANTLTPSVDVAGTYTLLVTDAGNGCTTEAVATVSADSTYPVADIVLPIPLTCTTTNITLDGSGSSAGANYFYQWYNDGVLVPNATQTTLPVNATGEYQIVVTDSLNGCTSNFSVTVQEDVGQPQVSATANDIITCAQPEVSLTATVAGDPANFSFSWTTVNGNILSGGNTATPTVDLVGSYDVVVTNLTNGCTSEAAASVTQDASIPEVVIAAGNVLNCNIPTLTLDASASTQGAGITFTWTTTGGNFVSGQNTLTPVVDGGGVYTLTIFDTNNTCESTDSVAITLNNTAPVLSLPSVPTLDCNLTLQTITGTVANFPGSDLTFEWTTLDGTLNGPSDSTYIDVDAPGTYTLFVTNINNGCTDEASVTIGQDIVPPDAVIANAGLLTCANNTVGLNANGSSTGPNFNYTWSTTDGSFVSGTNSLTPVVDSAGTYELLIINTSNGCTQSAQVVVGEDTTVPSADAGPAATLNCDFPQLTLNATASGGAQFEYVWTGPGVVSGGNTLTPVVDVPGTYNLLVTNLTNACSATAAVVIDENFVEPAASAGTGAELSCTLESVTLDGGGSSTGGNFAYLWTTANGSILSGETTLSPEVNAPGFYDLLVTNTLNGCTQTSQVEITEDDDLPAVDAGTAAPITCAVSQITLDGSGSVAGPNFVYQWTTVSGNILSGATGANPVVNAPGTYILMVTNTLTNCDNIASVTVEELTDPPASEAGTAGQLDCVVPSLSLDGTGSATGSDYTYQWTGPGLVSGAATLNPVVDMPGTYQILVTSTATGCTSTDQVAVPQDIVPPAAAAATPGMLTCTVESLNLTGAGSSAGSEYLYVWSTVDGNILDGETTLTPAVDAPGTYLLLVTDTGNGCTSMAQTVVSEDVVNPAAEAGSTDELTCTSPSLALNGNGSSTGGIFNYIWTTQNGNILNGNNTLTPSVNQPGTYELLVTNSVNGCTATDNVVITQDAAVPNGLIAPPGQLDCNVVVMALDASASQGNEFEYLWTTFGGSIIAGETTLSPQVNAPGTYILTVTNNDNGCTKEVQTTVTQDNEKPEADAGQAFVMDCFDVLNYLDGSASTSSGAINYQWTTAGGNFVSGANTPQPAVSEPGTYLLTITNPGNGCTDTDQVVITRDEPVAEPLAIQPPCFGDRGAIKFQNVQGGTPPYLYSLDAGVNFSNQSFFTQLEPAVYSVVVQDSKGCVFEDEIYVEQPELLTVAVEANAEIQLGDSYQINALVNLPTSELSQITWFPSSTLSCEDCLNPLATPDITTLYKLTVVTENGCEDTDFILVVVDKRVSIYVPNAFSPNGDGTNDVFMIFADPSTVTKIKSFLVFNRWGETVWQYFNFDPNNPAYGWDGHYRGQLMNPAVFAWFAEVEFVDGRVEIFKGDVTLVR